MFFIRITIYTLYELLKINYVHNVDSKKKLYLESSRSCAQMARKNYDRFSKRKMNQSNCIFSFKINQNLRYNDIFDKKIIILKVINAIKG